MVASRCIVKASLFKNRTVVLVEFLCPLLLSIICLFLYKSSVPPRFTTCETQTCTDLCANGLFCVVPRMYSVTSSGISLRGLDLPISRAFSSPRPRHKDCATVADDDTSPASPSTDPPIVAVLVSFTCACKNKVHLIRYESRLSCILLLSAAKGFPNHHTVCQ
jgi:hypothetical protein